MQWMKHFYELNYPGARVAICVRVCRIMHIRMPPPPAGGEYNAVDRRSRGVGAASVAVAVRCRCPTDVLCSMNVP